MRIVHIAQTHAYLGEGHKPTAEAFDRVVRSQFSVAQLIKQNPHCPVVCEAAAENRTYLEFSKGKILNHGRYEINVNKIQKIFPKGLPDHFDDLNRAQKEALYCAGATDVLLFLNVIPILYSSTDEGTAALGQDFFENDMRIAHDTGGQTVEFQLKASVIQSMREKAALAAIKRAAEAHYKEVEESSIIILVYGALHDFQPLCEEDGVDYQKVYTLPEQEEKYFKNSGNETTYVLGSPYWDDLDIYDVSKLDMDKINKHDWLESFSRATPNTEL